METEIIETEMNFKSELSLPMDHHSCRVTLRNYITKYNGKLATDIEKRRTAIMIQTFIH